MTREPRRLDPPAHYTPGDPRRAIWADTISRLTRDDDGGIFRADPNLIEVYVESVAAHRQASELLARTNVLVTRGDRAVANPALAIQRQTAADMTRAARGLGLHRTPMTAALAESPMGGDGRRWCDEHQRDECKNSRKRGGPCHQHVLIPGLGACRMHAGLSLEAARVKGQAQLARIYTGGSMDIDPAGALLWELGHSAQLVAELRKRVAELAAAPGPDGQPGSGLFWGTVLERERDGAVEREQRAGPHVILRALNDEADHLVKTAAAANAAGAMAAQVDAARVVGAGLYRLLEVILAGLELTPRQRDELVPVVIPAAIRAWDPAADAAGRVSP